MHGDFEKSKSKFAHLQGHMRSRADPDRPCCISVDAVWRDKHIGSNLAVLSLFYQKLEAKTAFDFI